MKLSNFTLKFFSLLLAAFVTLGAVAQVQSPRYASVTSNCKGFYEYLPEGYNSGNQTYPLILFIHGMGETGYGTASSLPLVLRNGPPRLINDGKFPSSFTVNGKTFRFIVISPQFIKWPQPGDIDSVLNYMVAHYRVDPKRIYLTGLSMGGGAAWNYAGAFSNYVKRLAGMVVVCGASYPAVARISVMAKDNLPIWALQNQTDPTVPVAWTTGYVQGLNSFVPVMTNKTKGTIFPGGGHDAWSHAYDPNFTENGMNVYQWMLQYTQDGATTPVTPPVAVNKAPVASGGADQTITAPLSSVTLTGSGTDADGKVVKYSWAQISGPAASIISNSNTASATVSNLAVGSYVIRLTVTDDDGATSYDDVTITVKAAPLPIPGLIEAEQYASMSGVQTEATTDSAGGSDVGWIDANDWMFYNTTVAKKDTFTFSFRVASANNGGQFIIKNNSGAVLATVNVPNTGGWQNWVTVKADAILDKGNQSYTIFAVTGGWNINWFSAAEKITVAAPAPPAADTTAKPTPPADTTAQSTPPVDTTVEITPPADTTGTTDTTIVTAPPTNTTVNPAPPVSSSNTTDTSGIVIKKIEVGVLSENMGYANKQWNAWNIDASTVSNKRSGKFTYTDGSKSTVNAKLSFSEKISDNSDKYVAGMAPKEVLRYASYSTKARVLSIKGLSPDKKYDIELYASRSLPGNSTIFVYKDQVKTIATYYNADHKVIFANITPDSTGFIVIALKSSNTFNYLNGFTIIEKSNNTGKTETSHEEGRAKTDEVKTNTVTGELNIFPNPVRDKFTMQLNNTYVGNVNVQIVNLSGQVVKTVSVSKQASTSQTDVYVKELPAGIYILQTQSGNIRLAKKLLKQ